MAYKGVQLTDTILMVRPVDFQFNTQTAGDNEFQHQAMVSLEKTRQKALHEFDLAVQSLRKAGIHVVILDYPSSDQPTPDAVFPNNWISLHASGEVFLYPMYAENRRAETLRFPTVQKLMESSGLKIHAHNDLRGLAADNQFLEGTGSIIFDHINKRLYASRSIRTHEAILDEVKTLLGYQEVIAFDAISSNGKPFYHTNVVLSIGEKHAILCADAVPEGVEKERLLSSLQEGRDVITISLEQTEKHFCGNTLQLVNRAGIPVIVMSKSAYQGFSEEQRMRLREHGELVPIAIDTIEYIGGGSARCMMAEVFLPKA